MVAAGTILAMVLGGAFWLDDRHAKQVVQDELKEDLTQLAAGVDLRFLQNQLASLELTGQCKLPQYIKLCEHLRRQIALQAKK